MRRAYGVVLASCLLLPACGGGDGGSPTAPQPTPTPAPVTTSIFNRSYSIAAFGAGYQDISVPNSGTVEVTFDWTFSTSDIDLVVTPTSCTDWYSAYSSFCQVLGSDKTPAGVKRARVSLSMSAAGTIRVWVYNFTSVNESGVLSATLTR